VRRLRFSRWAVVSAVALVTASVGIVGASSAATRELHGAGATTTPVPDQPLETAVLDPDSLGGPESATAYQHLRRTGARFVRIMMNWVSVAPGGATKPAAFRPKDPGDSMYNWGWTDAQVRDAVSKGFVPFIYVQTAPTWAESDSCGSWGIGSCRPGPRALADFMGAAARRYGGGFGGLPRVRYWQIWNEPNLLGYLKPQVDGSHRPLSPEYYRLMVNAAADAIHAVHSDNQVIAGGMSAFGDDPPGDKISPLLFMQKLLCLSAGKPQPVCHKQVRFDIWGHNPYTSGDPTHHANLPNDISLPDLWKMRRLLDAAVRVGTLKSRGPVRFWVTEFAWDTSPPDPKGVPEELHARWVAEALYRMWAQGVSLVTWYQIRDQPFTDNTPFQSGLYFRGDDGISSDTPKLALTAFRFPFVTFREPAKRSVMFWGRSPAKRAPVVIEQTTGASWRLVDTLRPNRYGIFAGEFSSKARSGFLRARLANGKDAALPFSLVVPPDRPGCAWGTC
jgi:hypothetical protein